MKPKPILNYKDSYTMHIINSYRFQEPWVNTGKYTYAELVDMIGVQGYIPVATADELNNLRSAISQVMGAGTPFEASYLTGSDKKYVQLKDIDLSSFPSWIPLPINGIYDGNLLEINNININYIKSNLAIFTQGTGALSAVLRNVITRGNLSGLGGVHNAGILYYNNETCIVENCINYANVTNTGSGAGGICAINRGTIIRCINFGTISTNSAGGGITESNEGSVVNCANYGTITSSNNYAGGIAASSSNLVEKCTNYGTITTSGYYAGGIVATEYGLLRNCNSFANVNADSGYAGGLVGYLRFLSEYPHTVENSYCVGIITGAASGGFCGRIDIGVVISNCYYDSTVSGLSDTGKGDPRTTTEMKAGLIPDTTIYVVWDPLIWDPGTVNDYPSLIGV